MTIKGRVIKLETMRSAQRLSSDIGAREVILSRLSVLADRMRDDGYEPRTIMEHLAAGDPDGRAREYLAMRFGIARLNG